MSSLWLPSRLMGSSSLSFSSSANELIPALFFLPRQAVVAVERQVERAVMVTVVRLVTEVVE